MIKQRYLYLQRYAFIKLFLDDLYLQNFQAKYSLFTHMRHYCSSVLSGFTCKVPLLCISHILLQNLFSPFQHYSLFLCFGYFIIAIFDLKWLRRTLKIGYKEHIPNEEISERRLQPSII